jgi:hypothetical protein
MWIYCWNVLQLLDYVYFHIWLGPIHQWDYEIKIAKPTMGFKLSHL